MVLCSRWGAGDLEFRVVKVEPGDGCGVPQDLAGVGALHEGEGAARVAGGWGVGGVKSRTGHTGVVEEIHKGICRHDTRSSKQEQVTPSYNG